MRFLRIASAAALAGTFTLSAAAPLSKVAPSVIERDVHDFVVAENGAVTEDDETTLRAKTPAGVDDIARC
jgi:hydroxymethylpyrimidine pyrophosphatase-like HAD family hydrolase